MRGGKRPVLAWLWRFGDGATAAGRSVVRDVGEGPLRVSVSVVDSTGSVVSASRVLGSPEGAG